MEYYVAGYELWMGSGQIQFFAQMQGGRTVATANIPDDGELKHIVVAIKGGVAVDFYSNGVKLGETQTMAYPPVSGSGYDFVIGQYGGAYFFNGLLDEIRVYSKALTSLEVKALTLNPGGLKAPVNYVDFVSQVIGVGKPETGAQVNTINAGDGLTALDVNADGKLNSLDSAAYFPGTVNFNPIGSIIDANNNPAGWMTVDGSGNGRPVYDSAESALKIEFSAPEDIGGLFSTAWPVNSKSRYDIRVKLKGVVDSGQRVGILIAERESDLPDGKYYIQPATIQGTSFPYYTSEPTCPSDSVLYAGALTTMSAFEEYSFTYTPSSADVKYASVVVARVLPAYYSTDNTLHIAYCKVINAATNDSDIRTVRDLIDAGMFDPLTTFVVEDETTGDFAALGAGDLTFYKYFGEFLRESKSVRQVKTGVIDSGVWTPLEGYWTECPTINVFPVGLPTYYHMATPQSQKQRVQLTGARLIGAGEFEIKGDAFLELATGSTEISPEITGTGTDVAATPTLTAIPTNTRRITANIRMNGCCGVIFDGDYHRCQIRAKARLVYNTNGSWVYGDWSPIYTIGLTYASIVAATHTTTADITQIYAQVTRVEKTATIIGDGNGVDLVNVALDTAICDLDGAGALVTGQLGYIAIGN